ncbi:DUF3558 family protein [Actinokineospora sp. NPDC004072]
MAVLVASAGCADRSTPPSGAPAPPATSKPPSTAPAVADPIALGGWADDPCGLAEQRMTMETADHGMITATATRASPTVCVWQWKEIPRRLELEVFPTTDVLAAEYDAADFTTYTWWAFPATFGYPAVQHISDENTCRWTIGLSDTQGLQIRQTIPATYGFSSPCARIGQVEAQALRTIVERPR